MNKLFSVLLVIALIFSCTTKKPNQEAPLRVSGIYPHLAMYNGNDECGTGAVVPWADRLWVITYGPHLPYGSDDKLFEITPDLEQIEREESLGGTPANRMIHKESKQLFIGPYAVDVKRNVRGIPYDKMQGRHTGNARHLFDPANKIYYGTMEEGFYVVDVHTLVPTTLYRDGNKQQSAETLNDADIDSESANLPGAHGKGLYSGQGVMVFSNNGEASREAMQQFDVEAGALAEWDGENWTLVRRNQFVEVTGPGGIFGNETPATDPIWATGWDHKSLILGVRNAKTGWDFYRLPKASHSYDGAHGWNTEWPRIRDIGRAKNPDYLMTMHGMFWKFPGTFTKKNSSGIRPRSAYLKVIGDFARWNKQLVFGCDDSAQKEFMNKRRQKGGIEGPGQSNSNLWFTDFETPSQLGPNTASGSVWLNDEVKANEISGPMLFAGWDKRSAWVHNAGKKDASFVFEVDKDGNNEWKELKTVSLVAGASANIEFSSEEKGEWVRVLCKTRTTATISFNYTGIDNRTEKPADMFNGLARLDQKKTLGGLLYGLGNNRKVLGISAVSFENGVEHETGYYELDEALNLVPKDDLKTNSFIKDKFAIPENVIEIQQSSVLVVDDQKRRWRLPLGNQEYRTLINKAQLRICREVATERDLFNCCGTFYELPAENADGFAKIRPVASHHYRIHDYTSYRGLLVMTGLNPDAKESEHLVKSKDGNAAVWIGNIDDLWKMGKPTGHGGPWLNSAVVANTPSDAYLISHYDKKTLELSHKSTHTIQFKIEVEPIGHGPWMLYKEVSVQPGETFIYDFPESFQARWIRFIADHSCEVTAWLTYD